MLLLKVTKVTTGHQNLPKMGQNSIVTSFFARRAKKTSAEGRSPLQELEVGPHSGTYLLVEFYNSVITCPVLQCLLEGRVDNNIVLYSVNSVTGMSLRSCHEVYRLT